jgi:hypothetical protein
MTEPTAIAIITPEERAENERTGQDLIADANARTIANAEDFTAAARWLQDVCIPLKKKVQDTFRPRIQQAHALHKGLLEDEKKFLGPIERAELLVRAKLTGYENEQRRKQREAEDARQRQQQELEAAERLRVLQENERKRKEAEDRQLAQAVDAEKRGDVETAQRLIEAPVEVPVVAPKPVFAPPAPVLGAPKVAGVSFTDVWDFELENLDEVPREYLKLDEQKVRAVVKALKDKTAIPGIKAVSRRSPTVKG